MVSDVARNPAFAPEEIERQRQQMLSALQVSYDDPGVPRRRGVRSAGLRLPSLRPAGHRHAGVARRASRATTCSRSTRPGSAPTTRSSPIVGDVTAEEAFAGAERAFGDWAQAPSARGAGRSSRRRRRGASSSSTSPTPCRPRSASATSALPRKHPDYLALDLADQDPRRRRRQPAAPRAALRARPDLRRLGRHRTRSRRRATSSPRPTPAPRRPAKRCG